MKKLLSIALTLLLVLSTASAFAAGKLNVAEEDFHVIGNSWSGYGYCYAKVENTGDKAIKVNAGVLEVYDADGNAINSSDYVSAYARYLQPGEYTYVKMYADVKPEVLSTVADHMMTLTGKSDNSAYNLRLPCETSLSLGEVDGWFTHNYIIATITNNTDTPLYDISTVLALLDADGKILYIDDDSLYSDRALMPGSSMIIRKEVYSSFIDYYTEKGLVPASVDAIAYVEVEKED